MKTQAEAKSRGDKTSETAGFITLLKEARASVDSRPNVNGAGVEHESPRRDGRGTNRGRERMEFLKKKEEKKKTRISEQKLIEKIIYKLQRIEEPLLFQNWGGSFFFFFRCRSVPPHLWLQIVSRPQTLLEWLFLANSEGSWHRAYGCKTGPGKVV